MIDVTSIYLTRALGLSVAKLLMEDNSSYIFNTTLASHSFPSGGDGPAQTFVPDNVDGFPNLEQVFWTIMDQYDSTSEPLMRENKDNMWCHHHGVGMYEHCKASTAQLACGGESESEQEEHCKMFWTFFMEACHRVRSLDPNDSKYSHSGEVERFCLGDDIFSSGNTIYHLLRNWERGCPEMREDIPSLANNTVATGGHLELVGAVDGFNASIRVPGSQMRYQCSAGFGMEDGSNPVQELQCLGSRLIDRTTVAICERKKAFHKSYI